MLFYPHEIKPICEKDGCQLQDGISLVESGQTGCVSIGYRNRDCAGTCTATRGHEGSSLCTCFQSLSEGRLGTATATAQGLCSLTRLSGDQNRQRAGIGTQ